MRECFRNLLGMQFLKLRLSRGIQITGSRELVLILKLFEGGLHLVRNFAVLGAAGNSQIVESLLGAGWVVDRIQVAQADGNYFLAAVQDQLSPARIRRNGRFEFSLAIE